MNKVAKAVQNYWARISPMLQWDSEVLSQCISVLSPEEVCILESDPGGVDADLYKLTMQRVFNRHNDICCGNTSICDNKLICTAKSSITELDIGYDVAKVCTKAAIYKIEDIEKPLLIGMTFEVIAELTAAIVIFNSKYIEDES